MKKTHLALDSHTLCHRRMDRFTETVFEDRDAETNCVTCRLASNLPHNAGAAPITVTTCDSCDTGLITTRESYDLPYRFDPTRMYRWHAWTSCDLHAHDVFDMADFRLRVQDAVDALTDDQYPRFEQVA